jgi:hypothetical protein
MPKKLKIITVFRRYEMDDNTQRRLFKIIARSLRIAEDKIFPETILREAFGLTLGDISLLLMDIDRELDYILMCCEYDSDDIHTISDILFLVDEAHECKLNQERSSFKHVTAVQSV